MNQLAERLPPATRAAIRTAITTGQPLHETLVTASDDIWQALPRHPWLAALATGALPQTAWTSWLQQYPQLLDAQRKGLLVLQARQLPRPLADLVKRIMSDCGREIDALSAAAADLGQPSAPSPWPTTLGYGAWFRITIEESDPVTALAVLYAVQAAHQRIWQQAGASCPPDSPVLPWVHNWTNAIFVRTVDGLAAQLGELAGPATEVAVARFGPGFQQALLWELRFFTMCLNGEDWWPS